jgi:hypothetical protein
LLHYETSGRSHLLHLYRNHILTPNTSTFYLLDCVITRALPIGCPQKDLIPWLLSSHGPSDLHSLHIPPLLLWPCSTIPFLSCLPTPWTRRLSPGLLTHSFLCVFGCGGSAVWTQGLALTRQALYHMSHAYSS